MLTKERREAKGALGSYSNSGPFAMSQGLRAFSSAYGRPVSGESGEERVYLGSKRGLQSSDKPADAITTACSDSRLERQVGYEHSRAQPDSQINIKLNEQSKFWF